MKREACYLIGADIIYKGVWYFHPALYGCRLYTILVRPVREKIKVYNPDGKFLCTASKFAPFYKDSGGAISK
jgi:hypothetical protein